MGRALSGNRCQLPCGRPQLPPGMRGPLCPLGKWWGLSLLWLPPVPLCLPNPRAAQLFALPAIPSELTDFQENSALTSRSPVAETPPCSSLAGAGYLQPLWTARPSPPRKAVKAPHFRAPGPLQPPDGGGPGTRAVPFPCPRGGAVGCSSGRLVAPSPHPGQWPGEPPPRHGHAPQPCYRFP